MIKEIIRPIYRKLLKVYVDNILEPGLRYTAATLDPRERMLNYAFHYIEFNKVEGDYMEFGVWKGHTFIHAYHLSRIHAKSMNFYAFDSFEGIPPNKEIFKDGKRIFIDDDYSCDLKTFNSNLSSFEVDTNRVTVVPGWYNETLTRETKDKLPLKSAAIVWMDCCLYESAKPVLDFITDYLVEGSIIISNNWFALKGDPEHGEHRAFDEWLEENPSLKAIQFNKFWWMGNSFIIYKT